MIRDKPILPTDEAGNIEEVVSIVVEVWEQFQDGKWANLSAAGNFIKRAAPDFDSRTYGVSKFAKLVKKLNSHFEMKKQKKRLGFE